MTTKTYEIDFQDVLGYGNYGTVYGATKVDDERRHFAVKIFKSSDASAEEIEMMEYLSNYKFEYIANIEEAMTLNGRKTIVMERLNGGEVFERILKDGSFSEVKAARCLICLVKALLDLNKKALVLHRDVKPENLVYISEDENSEIKLIDFGLAVKATPPAIEQGIRLSKRPAGTPSYMAPETIRACEYSAKSDVWSAGVTLYALLSGTAAFDQDNRIRQRQQILSGTYIPLNTPSWSHVSDEAKDLITKMLKVNPVDRISLEDILNHPWINRIQSIPESNFHEGYLDEIRRLKARSNFKKIVNATVLTVRLRRHALSRALQSPSGAVAKKSKREPSTDESTNNMDIEIDDDDVPSAEALPGLTKEQIRELKERFSIAAAESAERNKTDRGSNDRELAVDYQAFESIMYAVGLESFATPRIFEIFDTDGNNMVDYKEFISTLATFNGSDTDATRLYFEMFDIDGSGEISFDELKLVMAALLHEDDGNYSEHDRSSPAQELQGNSAKSSEKLSTTPTSSAPIDGNTPSMISRQPSTTNPMSSFRFFLATGASFSRMTSFARGEFNPFQSVFRFTPKIEEGRTIEDLFREMDVNKDGKISFEEFKGWMERDIDKLKTVVQDAMR